MSKKKNMVPALRFPGFSGVWEEQKLGQICEEFQSGKNIKAEEIKEIAAYPVYGGNGLRGYTDTYNHNGVYALIGRQGALCGNLNISAGEAYFTEHAIAVKANESSDTKFLFYLLGKMDLGQYSGQSAQPGLAVNKLIKLSAFIPNYDEQKQISEFFVLHDNMITLHQRKLTHLQTRKKGLLQKMFSKDGELFPELRFPGFTDAWEVRNMNDLVSQVVREVPKPIKAYERISVRSHAKGTFHQNVDDPSTVAMDKLYVVKVNDLIVNITFAWEHAIAVAKPEDDGLFVSHRFPTYRADGKSDIQFVRYMVSRENFRRKLEFISPGGAGRNRVLNKSDFLKIRVIVPTTLKEQENIGNYFNKLDSQIALHKRKLEHLQNRKKALLQQMFV